ncbi:MAG: phosphate signaling complex protein PhoU [Syntrophus sp. (in: bacteria)]|jgi:phosphate transport system protein|nr:phosphate signaling complex protein PhoU [Syntrophus sp. (in: bacteria)]
MVDRRHTSTHYEKELKELKDGLLYLGGLAENAIKNALQALVERNSELARMVIADDAAIDQLDSENEDRCIRILALRQPAARDLRFIATAIKINGHLERIGDMAVNIAEKVLLLNEEPQLKPYVDIPRMAEITQKMIRQSLDSLIREDVDLADQVRREDENVDNLNEQVFRELLTFMIQDPRTIRTALLIMQIAKNLERISDHAEGIADMVIYLVTGKSVRHNDSLEPKGRMA